jgi:hypothetical protein
VESRLSKEEIGTNCDSSTKQTLKDLESIKRNTITLHRKRNMFTLAFNLILEVKEMLVGFGLNHIKINLEFQSGVLESLKEIATTISP